MLEAEAVVVVGGPKSEVVVVKEDGVSETYEFFREGVMWWSECECEWCE